MNIKYFNPKTVKPGTIPGRIIQPKLEVNPPNDIYEKQADEVANRVSRMPGNAQDNLQMQPKEDEDKKLQMKSEEEDKNLQMKSEEDESVSRPPEDEEKGKIQMSVGSSSNNQVPQVSSSLASQLNSTKGQGSPLSEGVSREMGQKIGGNFNNVRVHTDDNAVRMNKELGAKAFTHGNDIYFNNGQYNPENSSERHLLVHELTHVIQQKQHSAQRKIMRAVTEQGVDAEFIKWADENKRVKDKTHKDFPWSAWDFIRPKIVDEVMDPLPKPKDPKELKEWQDNYLRAEIVARWLFTLKATSTDKDIKDDADSKAFYILDSLVKAGFVSKAIAQSGYLNADTRILVYNTILKNPSTASASELEAIVTFLCATVDDPTKVTIVDTLTNGNNSPLKNLDDTRTKAIIKPLFLKFGTQQKIIDAIAEILMFNPKVRASLSDSMMSSQIGNPDLLFKVLKHDFFIEPSYGATILQPLIPAGMSNEDYDKSRMKTDMPWVYTYKQKYYVQYLIDLAKSQSIIIPPPKTFGFDDLKTWLETNTENIGDAARKKYPTNPEPIFEIYRNITDIFFFHVDKGNITPDPKGKIAHLPAGEPSKKRLQADCDVFASYGMRFFFDAKFEPIGYIAIIPGNTDAHAGALIRKDNKYYVISNKNVLETNISETKTNEKKGDAIKMLSKLTFYDVYDDSNLKDLKIYYSDAGTNGEMPNNFINQDISLLRGDLDPSK
ncbi:MAG: DUF4157 domain-containing protein [Bacteroidales bacterium]|nr:DUF4157 domain-containing protein [Bacteroidales bacterium]